MDSSTNTKDILPYLEDLKISAFKKVDLIRNQIQYVTIGPSANLSLSLNKTEQENTSVNKQTTPKQIVNTNPKITSIPEINNDTPLVPFRQVLQEYEFLRRQKVQDAIHRHTKKFELFSAQNNQNKTNTSVLQQQKLDEKRQLYEEEVMLALKEYDQKKIDEQKLIIQNQQKLECEKKKIVAAIEAKKRESEILNQCLNNQSQFQSIFREIMLSIVNCERGPLMDKLSDSWKHCKELNELMEGLIEKCKKQISEQNMDMTEIILKRLIELQAKITDIIKSYHQSKLEESSLNISNSEKSIIQNGVIQKEVKQKEKLASISLKSQGSVQDITLSNSISVSRLEMYNEIREYHRKYTDSIKDFQQLDDFKQFRFDCKKAVNLSVNTISSTSSQHLHDKYVKLSNLLSGKKAAIGDFQIIASKHPKGIPYCIDLLAKKFVLQGDLMVSCNPESAFSFATIIVSIWNECQDFGRILLSYFYDECVYLIPFYPPRLEDQTDQEYYQSQGYRYTGDKVEDQDKFLKRMMGTMRLYFAILISSPKRNQSRHPCYINHAWTWLVSVLKLRPSLDITATMLHTFFETIGFEMQRAYGKQFTKVMKYFVDIYFPLMKENDTGGPVTRLECLIQEYKHNSNKFQVPKGVLPEFFW